MKSERGAGICLAARARRENRMPVPQVDNSASTVSATVPAGAEVSHYEQTVADWRRRTPWYRRLSAAIGIQGKLMLCFFTLLSVGLGISCWMFASHAAEQLSDVMGEQARQLSSALALSSEDDIRSHNTAELRRVAQDLIKSRNILFVGFLDAESKPLMLASRDLNFGAGDLIRTKEDIESLMQVRDRTSALFGDYVEVVAPILSNPAPPVRSWEADGAPSDDMLMSASGVPANAIPGQRLLGYVAVGVSQAREVAQIRRTNIMIAGLGGVIVLLSVPLGYVLIYRVFLPIRELVSATQQIIAGDLDTRVAFHRPDVIGTLARSFNEMVIWVKKEQQQLAAANAMLADANRDLEAKVVQRTAQLEAANQRLSSEIAEKEDFLRAVSHDLNAPLRNIAGMASMLLLKYRERLDEDVAHRLGRIQKNVEVEMELIGELLELSRIKTRRQQMEHVELSGLVAELREMFENDLNTRGIQLIVDTPLPVVECERARMRQVFQNLIDNAIKYMGEGATNVAPTEPSGSAAGSSVGRSSCPLPSREIHIGCALRVTEAEFYVRDTGMGIEPEDLDKIFYVFRRGKGQQVQSVVGRGVGLATVKSIIETCNGKIWVDSRAGHGSTFRFTINGRHVPAAQQLSGDSATTGARREKTSSYDVVEEGSKHES
jgi:signal transduction histidine kinase